MFQPSVPRRSVLGLPVDILDTSGTTLAKSTISFLSPQVDNGLQSILAKAEIPRSAERLRNQQLVKARSHLDHRSRAHRDSCSRCHPRWRTDLCLMLPPPRATDTSRTSFRSLLGETVGNTYPVLAGLKPGDKVILSGLQFLQEGAPVKPLG